MRSMQDLLEDEKYAAALAEAEARRAAPPAPATYAPPDKPLHQYTDAELQAAAAHCAYCSGIGYVQPAVESPADPHFGELWHCPACRSFRDEQRRRRILEQKRPLIEQHTMLKGDLLKCTFSSFDHSAKETKAAWAAVRGWAGGVYNARPEAPWLYLHGPVGNGKTHLAAAAANGLTGVHVATIFTTLPELLGMVSRDGFRDYETAVGVLQQIPVLIVDDVRAEDLTADWKLTALFRILDSRYVTRAATMLVSNLPVVGQQGEPAVVDFEPRIASRLQDTSVCRILAHIAPDYRPQR